MVAAYVWPVELGSTGPVGSALIAPLGSTPPLLEPQHARLVQQEATPPTQLALLYA
jgi:hypothetical protein